MAQGTQITQSITSTQAGLSLVEVTMGMGIGAAAILGVMQFMEYSMRTNRGVQARSDFTMLTGTINQLVMNKDICLKTIAGQVFDPALTTAQPVALKDPMNSAVDLISTAKNPYAPVVKVTQLTLTKMTGASGNYMAQMDVKGTKEANVVGSKVLSTILYVNLNVDETSKKILGCSGSGDYVQRDYLEQRIAEAGTTGGGCFETTAADCGANYKLQVIHKRYACTYGIDWKVQSEAQGMGYAAMSGFTNSLVPCPDTSVTYSNAVKSIGTVDVKVCCK